MISPLIIPDSENIAHFAGRKFVHPTEIPHQLGRGFYKAEILCTTGLVQEPVQSVVGKCVVLDLSEYCSQRPTQHQEEDIFCCESYFDEGNRVIMPLPSSLKKYQHGLKVKKDEVYVFKRPISPEKEALPPPPTPRNISSPVLDVNEDSMDAPPSVGSVESGVSPAGALKKIEKRKKLVTAYILFRWETVDFSVE